MIHTTTKSSAEEVPPGAPARLLALGTMALWIMAPVTMPVPVLRELVQGRFEVSELLTSLFMSINMVGALIAAPAAGAIADRLGRRRVLLIGGIVVDALCFFALTADVTFAVFLAIRFVEGCAHITALSILLTMASQALPAERRGRAMGLVGGCMMLGIALGAPIGGLLGSSNALLPLRVGGVLLLAAAGLAAVATHEVAVRGAPPGLRGIVAALRVHPAILAPLAFAFADRFTVGFFTTTFSLYVGRIYGLSASQIGLAIAVFMLPFALLSYPFGRLAERRSQIAMLCGGSAVYGIGTACVGFVGPPSLYGLMFVLGLTAAVMFVPSMLMTVEIAPARIRATAIGAFNAAGSLGFVVGPVSGGAISELVAARADWLTGYRTAFVVAGASELLCVAVALPILLRLRRRTGRS